MAAVEPLVSPDPAPIVTFPGPPARRSRMRPIVAAFLLVVLGLLAAASVFASRSYRHAPVPASTTPLGYRHPLVPGTIPGTKVDPC